MKWTNSHHNIRPYIVLCFSMRVENQDRTMTQWLSIILVMTVYKWRSRIMQMMRTNNMPGQYDRIGRTLVIAQLFVRHVGKLGYNVTFSLHVGSFIRFYNFNIFRSIFTSESVVPIFREKVSILFSNNTCMVIAYGFYEKLISIIIELGKDYYITK